jgi:hypothetical protein
MRAALAWHLRLAAASGLVFAGPATAFDYVVNQGGDMPFGFNCAAGQPCTLREAVQQAALGPGNRVLITVAQCNLDSTLIIDNAHFSIEGGLPARTRLRMNNPTSRVLLVRNSDLDLRHLDLVGGEIAGQGAVIAAFPLQPNPATALRIHDSIVAGGSSISGGQGGGVYARDSEVVLDRVELSGNVAAGEGGGLFVDGGSLTLRDSLVERNESGARGGGIYTANTVVNIDHSLIAENLAALDGGGALISVNQMTISNTTFYGNAAITAGNALSISGGATSGTINNVTFRHVGAATASELAFLGSPPIALRNSIVAGTCSGAPLTATANIESPGNTCALPAGNQVNVSNGSLALGALADNGGPTRTLMPQASSVAIDSGGADCEADDQRHYVRNAGACDVGAAEVGASLPDAIFANGFE